MKGTAVVILVVSIALISLWDWLFKSSSISAASTRLLWLLSICLFLYTLNLLSVDLRFESKYFSVVFSVFLLYQFILVVRGLSFSTKDLIPIFRESQNFWPFIIPLFVYFDKRFYNIVGMIHSLYWMGLVFLIFNICFPSILTTRVAAQNIIPGFALGCGFVLMNAKYLDNKKTNLSFLIITMSALSYIYLARRSAALTMIGFLVASYLLNTFCKSGKVIFKLFPLVAGIGLLLILKTDYISDALTKKMSERILEDSRTELVESFLQQAQDFMIFGKGMNGTYYYPTEGGLQEDGVLYYDEEYRNNIENGYLQLVLTGGIVHIILFVLILLPAAYNGIIRSSNQFSKACGVIVLLWLIDMFFYGLPLLSIHYMIVWICVGICYKESIRRMSEDEVKREFEKYNRKIIGSVFRRIEKPFSTFR